MIHPDLIGVRTLIFDMDGTLMRSGDLATSALRGGLEEFYRRRGEIMPERSDEELRAGIGQPAHEFYSNLLDLRHRSGWRELHSIIFEREKAWLESHRITYPGAVKTLQSLKQRGYHLALVSNCSSHYLQVALASQGFGRYFERAVCIGDVPGATKTDLVADVVRDLGGPAVVIGDRDYDIEAAKANGLPAVGALYGYGGRDELLGTDTWVEDVRDLAYLFYPLRELATRFAIQAGKRLRLDRPIVVGLSGVHPSLTGELAQLLTTEIADNKITVSHLRLERHRVVTTASSADRWITESYPWRRLGEEVLQAARAGRIDTSWPVTSGQTIGEQKPYRGRPGSIVLVEGPFLYGAHLEGEFDYSIWVDTPVPAVPRQIKKSWRSWVDRQVRIGVKRAEAGSEADQSIARDLEQWDRQGEAVAKEFLRFAFPGEMADILVDGNRLEQGRLLKG